MTGWIKLHRQYRESPYYKIGAATQTWLECLLRASHEQREVFLKRERVILEPGQFVMGREEFGACIGLSGSTAWYWLLQFESDSMVDIKKTAKGSLVTVKNWIEYQTVDSTSDNKKTADEQQMNTNKKDKKEKNTYASRPETESLAIYINELCTEYQLTNKVNSKALDIAVARHISTGIHLRVEVRKCISWLIDHGKREVTTQRIVNWFEKAREIQKRDQNKQLETKAKMNQIPGFRINPSVKDRLTSSP